MGDPVPNNPTDPGSSAACAAAAVPASPPPPLRMEVTSEPASLAAVRRAAEAFAAGAGFDPKAVGDVGLSVNEAMANVIRHAYGGRPGRPIIVTAECDYGRGAGGAGGAGGADCPPVALRLTIRDWGNGIDPTALPAREHDPHTPGGLGLMCLRALMDSVVYTPQPDGMLLTLEKKK